MTAYSSLLDSGTTLTPTSNYRYDLLCITQVRRVCNFLGLSHDSKNLKRQMDQCYSSVLFGKQRKLHSQGVRAGQPKDAKRRETRGSILAPLFIRFFLLPLSLPYVNCQPGGLFASPEVLTPVLEPSFVLFSQAFSFLCLLATTIDSFFLFQLPNIPPSKDQRPSSFGIWTSRSLWLLPAELGQQETMGLPLASLKLQSPYNSPSKGRVEFYIPLLNWHCKL